MRDYYEILGVSRTATPDQIKRWNEELASWKPPKLAGRVQGHPDGFGFLVPDDGSDDLFLSSKQMLKVLHGDRAIARVIGTDRRGRPEGKLEIGIDRIEIVT